MLLSYNDKSNIEARMHGCLAQSIFGHCRSTCQYCLSDEETENKVSEYAYIIEEYLLGKSCFVRAKRIWLFFL
jgi:hypothetical protein